jgi:hypothetical protein
MDHDDWWRVRNGDVIGFVPSAYLLKLDSNGAAAQPTPKPRPESVAQPTVVALDPEPEPEEADVFGVMNYAYTAQDETQLTVEEGVKVLLIRHEDGADWWFVESNDVSGYVPSSYVVRDGESSKPGMSLDMDMGESSTDGPSIQTQGSGVLSLGDALQEESTVDDDVDTAAGAVDATSHRYKVLFDYVAQGDDELSVRQGQTVQSKQELPSEPGWVYCSLDDKQGHVPSTYLRSGTLQLTGLLPS